MFASCGIPVERMRGGEPILAPMGEGWESGHTYNAAAVRLGAADGALIRGLIGRPTADDPALSDGVVAVLYRAQPRVSPGFRHPRSSVGLALFTPDLHPIRRFADPVISPAEGPWGYDRDGVEDPRVTRFGDAFYLVYCGHTLRPDGVQTVQVCLARSEDLLHWEKLGPVRGDVNRCHNKDGALLPERVEGRYVLLHRPMEGSPSQFSIELAVCESLTGEWRNCGKVLSAPASPLCRHSWVGAGPEPLPLGDGRYLVIYHTGNYLKPSGRYYSADAALFDFRRFSPDRPGAIVTRTVQRVLVPETPYERWGVPADPDPLHCIFPCGNYEHGEHVHLIYGGRDSYVLAARVRKDALLARLGSECLGS